MPTEADRLTPESSADSERSAVSSCISQMVKEGRSQEQAVAICMEKARTSTGRKSKSKSTTIG